MSVIKSHVQSVHYICKIRSFRCDPYTIYKRIGTLEGLGGGFWKVLEPWGWICRSLAMIFLDLNFKNLQNFQNFENF